MQAKHCSRCLVDSEPCDCISVWLAGDGNHDRRWHFRYCRYACDATVPALAGAPIVPPKLDWVLHLVMACVVTGGGVMVSTTGK